MRILPLSRVDELNEPHEPSGLDACGTSAPALATPTPATTPKPTPAPRLTPRLTSCASALGLVDDAVAGPVLASGALPPLGSDLDLLAAPREEAAIRAALVAAGFVERRGRFARFAPGQVEVVECVPTAAWALPPDALATLFTEARPLPGTCHLVRPSPQHELLIRARKAAQRRILTAHQREAIRAIDESDPEAWDRAQADARAWQARYALALLRARYESSRGEERDLRWRVLLERCTRAAVRSHARRVLRRQVSRFRYPPIVAFSGLDGAGKTLQAALLRDALAATGQDAIIVWKGVGRNRVLGVLRKLVSACVRRVPHAGRVSQALDEILPDLSEAAPSNTALPAVGDWRRRGTAFIVATYAWASLIALTHVLAVHRSVLRAWGRGRVLIYDRYRLDSVVRLLMWYGDCPATRLLTRVVAVCTPRPVAAFLLDLPAEAAFERKGEWGVEDLRARETLYLAEYARLGVARLDATLPIDALSAHIAAAVWRSLP